MSIDHKTFKNVQKRIGTRNVSVPDRNVFERFQMLFEIFPKRSENDFVHGRCKVTGNVVVVQPAVDDTTACLGREWYQPHHNKYRLFSPLTKKIEVRIM